MHIELALEGVVDHFLIVHGQAHNTDCRERPAADVVDGNRLRSHQAEHLAEQFLVDTLQPGRIQLISQNLDGLDKPDGYDRLIETLGHHLTAAPHHVVVTFAENIFFVVQLELLIMLCVELHDPDRIIPVLGLAGGLVDQPGCDRR